MTTTTELHNLTYPKRGHGDELSALPSMAEWREGGEFRSTVGRSNSRKKALIPIPKGGQTVEADVTVQCNADWIEGYGMLQNPVTYSICSLSTLNEVPDTSNMVYAQRCWKVEK